MDNPRVPLRMLIAALVVVLVAPAVTTAQSVGSTIRVAARSSLGWAPVFYNVTGVPQLRDGDAESL
jgi:hypothetical protein